MPIVMCHMSCVTCHVSRVTRHMSHVKYNIFLFIFLEKVLKLVGGGSVIKGATLTGLFPSGIRGPPLDYKIVKQKGNTVFFFLVSYNTLQIFGLFRTFKSFYFFN